MACHNITWSPPRVGRVTVPRFIIVQPTNSSTKKQWVEISSNSNFWNRAVELWLGSWTLPNFISIKQANKLKQNGEIGSRLSTTVRKTWAWCMIFESWPPGNRIHIWPHIFINPQITQFSARNRKLSCHSAKTCCKPWTTKSLEFGGCLDCNPRTWDLSWWCYV